ncbi:MAG: hypothetical protein JWR81_5231 [Pseudonocardia sp.]|jgi:hypothetical protein|nr:hypothetical protein [Pseudonocardia sp.]
MLSPNVQHSAVRSSGPGPRRSARPTADAAPQAWDNSGAMLAIASLYGDDDHFDDDPEKPAPPPPVGRAACCRGAR